VNRLYGGGRVCPLTLTHEIFGCGKPSALHVRLTLPPSTPLTVCVVSLCLIVGGTGIG